MKSTSKLINRAMQQKKKSALEKNTPFLLMQTISRILSPRQGRDERSCIWSIPHGILHASYQPLMDIAWSCTEWGLPRGCITTTPRSLLHYDFTFTRISTHIDVREVCFCCTLRPAPPVGGWRGPCLAPLHQLGERNGRQVLPATRFY